MVKAYKLQHNQESICGMCRVKKVINYNIVKWLNVCQKCYDSIPDHIPLSQDSQYVETFIKKAENDLYNM